MTGVEYVLKIVNDGSVEPDLNDALHSAQNNSPDLKSALGQSSGYLGLFVTFMNQMLPDVQYDCNGGNRYQPCSSQPAAPAPTANDPTFNVQLLGGGSVSSQGSMYTFDPVAGVFDQTRVTPDGFFVTTKYPAVTENKVSGIGTAQPTGSPGVTTESYRLNYIDGNTGKAATAELIRDPNNYLEFVTAPIKAAGGSQGWLTHSLNVQAPDGSYVLVQISEPPAQVQITRNVPSSVVLGQPFTLSASAAPGNIYSKPPYTYQWAFEGKTYNSSTATITLPDTAGATIGAQTAEANAIELTVTDSSASPNHFTYYYPVTITAPVDSTLVSSVSNPIFGAPVEAWDHVLSVCDNGNVSSQGGVLCGNAGFPSSVQFSVNGVPTTTGTVFYASPGAHNCPPAPAVCTGWWARSGFISPGRLGVNSDGTPDVITASYAGSDRLQPSSAAPLDITVTQATSKINVLVNLPDGTQVPLGTNLAAQYGQPLTFTAKVLSANPNVFQRWAGGAVQSR